MGYVGFFAVAIPLVLAALGVVLNRNPVRSALSLVVALFLLAVLFLGLEAHLLGFLQIIVYAGAIMVLFLFVIMLLNLQAEPPSLRSGWLWLAASAGGAGFAFSVIRVTRGTATGLPGPGVDAAVSEAFGTTTAVSDVLFTRFLLPFEITSILLLVAIIGSVVMAQRKQP